MKKFEKMDLQKFETEKIENLSKLIGGDGSSTTDPTNTTTEPGVDPTDAVRSRTKSNSTNE